MRTAKIGPDLRLGRLLFIVYYARLFLNPVYFSHRNDNDNGDV